MGRIKCRSRTLLVSAAVAFVLIAQTVVALPSQERKPGELLLELVDFPPDIAAKAPLMRRAGGESGAAHARYLRQVEADAVFESSRLAAKAQRQREARGNLHEGPDGSVLDQPASQSSNWEDTTTSNVKYHHIQGRMNDPDDPNGAGVFGIPSTPVAGERYLSTRDHHHSHLDDHSKGGHSGHWFEHHGLKPSSHYRTHHHGHHDHHTRHKRKSPSRLIRVRGPAIEDDDPVTLIAPRSAQSMVEKLLDTREGEGTSSPGIPEIGGTETEVEWFDEEENLDSLDRPSEAKEAKEAKLDKRGTSTGGDPPTDGIPGIIDLVQDSPNGEKLGGLSVSSMTPNGTSPIVSSSIIALIIDSTPNLIDQTTFLLHAFKDQSTIAHEKPSAGASRDLLVSLEILHTPDNAPPQRMCATFNPLELDVQVFGLVLCMDQDSATNNRQMSQAFRYSPDTGVLTPFYGAEGARQLVLAAVNERIQVMNSSEDGQLPSTSRWNGTGIYDLDPKPASLSPDWTNHATSDFGFDSAIPLEGSNSTYKPYSDLDSFSASYPSGSAVETAWSSKTMIAAAPTPTPLLSVINTSMTDHPFVVGAPAGESVTIMGEGTSLSVLMVFHSNVESSSWRRTKQDVDTPEERQKSLESYQKIGLASKDATKLDHWAVIDRVQPGSIKSSPKPASSAPGRKTTELVAPNGAGSGKIATPVGFWSDSGVSRSDGAGRVAGDAQSNEDDTSEDDDSLPPKPVLNAAYFGDSGRSAPVPPDEQADFARPILVADPLAKPHMASKLDLDEPEQDASALRTFPSYHGQAGQISTPGVMAAMSKSRIGPLGIPIDASD
ncbi:hypothetical protein B0J17DRAFT_293666 [Rhizoctonia solani]|nr:hypothetical protein B0J17DRAFT_293666 [Rhizoctonia solani]